MEDQRADVPILIGVQDGTLAQLVLGYASLHAALLRQQEMHAERERALLRRIEALESAERDRREDRIRSIDGIARAGAPVQDSAG